MKEDIRVLKWMQGLRRWGRDTTAVAVRVGVRSGLAFEAGLMGALGADALLNLLPNGVAGLLLYGLEKQAGLLGDVLQVADQGSTVLTGAEVLVKKGVFGERIFSGSKEIGQIFLELSTGHGKGTRFVVIGLHSAASLATASSNGAG
jgi:hypothetical protein